MAEPNPIVFFELAVDGKSRGKIVMELFADTNPMTAENFRSLCTGELGYSEKTGYKLHYKGTHMFKVSPGQMWCGGNISGGQGEKRDSVFGGVFKDEDFIHNHSGPGILSMINCGPNTNASEFMILKRKIDLDGVNVVFGKVVEGMDVLESIEKDVAIGVRFLSEPVVVIDSGEIPEPDSDED